MSKIGQLEEQQGGAGYGVQHHFFLGLVAELRKAMGKVRLGHLGATGVKPNQQSCDPS
jgi:hypothetical protein